MARALYSIKSSPCDTLTSLSLSFSLTHTQAHRAQTGVAYEGQWCFTVVLIGSLESECWADWLSALNQTLSSLFIKDLDMARSQ